MVYIKNISVISQAANECEVTLGDGTYEAVCFSQPFDAGTDIETIHVFECVGAVTIVNETPSVERIGTRDEIGPVYATKSLDRFAFKIYSDGQWLVFPASGAGEASQLYWTWIWESWQNPE